MFKHLKFRLTRVVYLILAALYVFIMRPLFDPIVIKALMDGVLPYLFSEKPLATLITLAAPFATLYLLYRAFFMHRQQERRIWKQNKKYDGATTVVTFFDGHFVDVSKGVTYTVQYSELVEIEESAEIIFLKTTNVYGFVISKSDFTIGTPDDFRAFIEEKTGKKIKFIR
ncbi:MAG: YcxB family protein [Clostridia bacterium]|nr:YcxB family protein [Clostridia bacterium]